MQPHQIKNAMMTLVKKGLVSKKVEVITTGTPDWVAPDPGSKKKGKVEEDGYISMTKIYTFIDKVIANTRYQGPLELKSGDQIELHETITDRVVSVNVIRNGIPKGVLGRVILTDCADMKQFILW